MIEEEAETGWDSADIYPIHSGLPIDKINGTVASKISLPAIPYLLQNLMVRINLSRLPPKDDIVPEKTGDPISLQNLTFILQVKFSQKDFTLFDLTLCKINEN